MQEDNHVKKILILSYHSLPLDVIASYRAMAYLKHLKKFGIDPTLLTHHWDDSESKEISHEYFEYGTIIRVPIKNLRINSLISGIEYIPIINKLSILIRWLRGQLDSTAQDWNSYASLRSFCFDYLRNQHFDILLGIFSPHHHLKLCYEINKKFQIPYVLDFRDLWSNRIIHKKYNPNFVESIQDRITKYYWKKWLKNALFFSITSSDWLNKINDFSDTNGIVIHNGFDWELFANYRNLKNQSYFIILHAGTLYSHQKLEIFLQGCKLFIKNRKPKKFKVKFIGSDRPGVPSSLSGFMSEPKKLIRGYLNKNYCEVTKRIPKTELVPFFEESQLLLFPGIPDSPGTHLGKIFDYLGARRNIFVVPDDKNVVSELVLETKSGIIANTPEEVCNYLTLSYETWEKGGEIKYFGDQKVIGQYSRQNQVGKMAKEINQHLS